MVAISEEDAPSDRVIAMETAFRTAVKLGQIPGAVIMARDFSGEEGPLVFPRRHQHDLTLTMRDRHSELYALLRRADCGPQ
ncbi:uncharacterized protein BP01DRAFT_353725 [Aspergillus saccharolyticus JOP 1030-1]|uniref:Uncharacterized protein n=1 Tax=Aspergillus saccharolyticus JOP 1030-1 TaxID=1450539 RepID=A0A319AQ96_9EURO|nr:hypothetical protein BP01DRAFT_353725 [Aspergillus saccharolyticus JOP 1030-1]PYH48582.1 hypothetical protein BP01DRAFT_353725 [Aspergillus saccharolyticus JOP 1030-1]